MHVVQMAVTIAGAVGIVYSVVTGIDKIRGDIEQIRLTEFQEARERCKSDRYLHAYIRELELQTEQLMDEHDPKAASKTQKGSFDFGTFALGDCEQQLQQRFDQIVKGAHGGE